MISKNKLVMATLLAIVIISNMVVTPAMAAPEQGSYDKVISFNEGKSSIDVNFFTDSTTGNKNFFATFKDNNIDKRSAFEAINKSLDPNLSVFGKNGTNGSKNGTYSSSSQDTIIKPAAGGTTPTEIWLPVYGIEYYGNNYGFSNVSTDCKG